jgi:hypothetical protein
MDMETKKTEPYKPNSKTGKYILNLNRGKKYSITVSNPGYQTYSEELSTTDSKLEAEITQEIKMKE